MTVVGEEPANASVRAEQYYQQGVGALKRGDAKTARSSFEAALRLNPSHANARFQLLELKGTEGKLGGKARELRLGQIQLPMVKFEDATLAEVLEALDLLVRKETKEEFAPNFVVQDPGGTLAKAKINIQLRNVPAKEALRYALEQSGAVARYEQHAVVIRPSRSQTEPGQGG